MLAVECTHAYIGRKPCGCIVAAAVINPEHIDDLGSCVGEWITDGLTIEHHSIEWVRENFTHCDCES